MRQPVRRGTLLAMLAAAVSLVAVVGLGLAASLTRDRHEAQAEPAQAVTVRTAAEQAEHANVVEITRLLTRLPAELAKGHTDSLTTKAATRTSDVKAALPADAVVGVDETSWRRTGDVGSVTVTVTRPSAPATRFMVVLINQNTGWKVSETFPLGTS